MITRTCFFSLLLFLFTQDFSARAQSSAFTYQGRLNAGTTVAQGDYEMTFTLYDAATNGNVVGAQTVAPVAVTNGQFAATLDFGASAFPGAPRWLEISVNVFGSDMIPTTLAPRQPITSAPYAIQAANAANLTGQGGTALDIKVGGTRALRIEPTTGAGNIIGGYSQNSVSNGAVGAFIGGGGLNDFSEGNYPNRVNASYSAIVGGFGNTVNDESSFIGGGENNRIDTGAYTAAIVGGHLNRIDAGSYESFIGAGRYNVIEPFSPWSVIAGGYQNAIGSNSPMSAILGGTGNVISTNANRNTIAGGSGNRIGGNTFYNFVGGGNDNEIEANVTVATIAGGEENTIQQEASLSTIGGGENNVVSILSAYSSIDGGYMNIVGFDSPYSSIGGGTLNEISLGSHYSTIAGGQRNHVESPFTTISGGFSNFISFQAGGAVIAGGMENGIDSEGVHSTIGGGFQNFIDHDAGTATISGGRDNNVKGDGGSIGGGWGNTAHGYAVVGGGFNNFAYGSFSTVSGGTGNTNGGEYGVLAGGLENVIVADAEFATIGGGATNLIRADATFATIAGGLNNSIGVDSDFSAISGGEANSMSQSCEHAVIAGGKGNRIEKDGGYLAAIGGGLNNTNRGNYSVIPGGRDNLTEGDYTFAAGRRARARHQGAFVWADSSDHSFASSGQNEFAVRAVGGARFVSAIDASGSNTAGVVLAPGAGGWSNLSDRNAKANFSPVNPREILEKVAALPVATWNYKSQAESIRHIGPMAQDFHAAFGMGENERTITTVDADGVALAAIKGLNEKVEAENRQLRADVASRDAKLTELQKRLDLIETMLRQKSGEDSPRR